MNIWKPLKRRASSRHLVGLVYCLSLLGLVALLYLEKQHTPSSVSLTRAVVSEAKDAVDSLVLHGKGMRKDVRILHAPAMLDENLHRWEVLTGSPVRAVAVRGEIALVACFLNKLVSLDLAASPSPQPMGSLDLPDTIREIKIYKDLAVIGLNRSGLAFVDLRNPQDMKLLSHLPQTGYIAAMVVSQDGVYYLEASHGVGLLDLATDNSVVKNFVPLSRPWKLAISGEKLAIAEIKGKLQLFDVLQDGSLTKRATLHFPVKGKGGRIRGVAFSKQFLAVALSEGVLKIYDLNSWPNLTESSQMVLPALPYKMVTIPGRESFALSLTGSGVALVNVTPEGNAELAGHLPLPTTFQALEASADKVYVSGPGHYSGLRSFSLDVIRKNRLRFPAPILRQYYKFYSWDGQLFGHQREQSLVDLQTQGTTINTASGNVLFARGRYGVSVFERREDDQVLQAGSLVSDGRALDAMYLEGSLFVLHNGGLRILDGPSLEKMADVGSLEISGKPHHMRALNSGYLLVATDEEGVKVVNVTDRDHPFLTATFLPPHHLQSTTLARDFLTDGHIVYMSFGIGGVYIVDFSAPENPELLQIIDTPGQARKMVLHEGLLLVADGDMGIYMIDVRQRSHGLPIGSLPMPINIQEIAVATDGLIVSNYPAGSMKIPFPQRLRKVEVVSQEEVRGEVTGVDAGGYAYLYDRSAHSRVLIESPQGH